MAIIHHTTLKPTKLELLTDWLPHRPWYRGAGTPELSRTGGFRLDDPAGEVGMEFMAVTDTSGPEPVTYHVPMAYRGAPLPDAPADALIGTTEHGVLGKRWIYDGMADPVLLTELGRLLRGEAPAHAQSVDGALDPTVGVRLAPGAETGRPEAVRVLAETRTDEALAPGVTGEVSARWRTGDEDGPLIRGVFVRFRTE
ncbi:maltokinase N-terminal cap-like domain-containing protein [Streptomyces xanthii]|uniref:1,4-alpha-glucan branching protein n=1 Tax=Streptomyces xanthii TaxID=2768069 RepID=A0A7H1B5N5_9ACTN|nr:1,4-alpha-glucan branching protein [Streptomyces xanthii]QNS04040.1 1,4-alpha-glucan branching protein [Streptomyces xanthii]